MATKLNHAIKTRPDGFGALCGSLSLSDTLLKRKDITCPNCAAMLLREAANTPERRKAWGKSAERFNKIF